MCPTVSWMCTKQTAGSHSSAKTAVILLDGKISMAGIPALMLWDCVWNVFG